MIFAFIPFLVIVIVDSIVKIVKTATNRYIVNGGKVVFIAGRAILITWAFVLGVLLFLK